MDKKIIVGDGGGDLLWGKHVTLSWRGRNGRFKINGDDDDGDDNDDDIDNFILSGIHT